MLITLVLSLHVLLSPQGPVAHASNSTPEERFMELAQPYLGSIGRGVRSRVVNGKKVSGAILSDCSIEVANGVLEIRTLDPGNATQSSALQIPLNQIGSTRFVDAQTASETCDFMLCPFEKFDTRELVAPKNRDLCTQDLYVPRSAKKHQKSVSLQIVKADPRAAYITIESKADCGYPLLKQEVLEVAFCRLGRN